MKMNCGVLGRRRIVEREDAIARARSRASIRSSSGLGILLKSLKRPMMVFRLAISMPRVCVLSRKTSSNSAGGNAARAHQVLDGELQRETEDS
jgi:hypothetical protein